MKPLKVRIHFEDDVPRMGQGKRIVAALIGRKWVRLRDALGHTAKITVTKYHALKPEPFEVTSRGGE